MQPEFIENVRVHIHTQMQAHAHAHPNKHTKYRFSSQALQKTAGSNKTVTGRRLKATSPGKDLRFMKAFSAMVTQ